MEMRRVFSTLRAPAMLWDILLFHLLVMTIRDSEPQAWRNVSLALVSCSMGRLIHRKNCGVLRDLTYLSLGWDIDFMFQHNELVGV